MSLDFVDQNAPLSFLTTRVPDDRLWAVTFDEFGARTADPTKTERCSYFVNRSYFHRLGAVDGEYTISHLEFVTETGLGKLVAELLDNEWDGTFPARHIINNML